MTAATSAGCVTAALWSGVATKGIGRQLEESGSRKIRVKVAGAYWLRGQDALLGLTFAARGEKSVKAFIFV